MKALLTVATLLLITISTNAQTPIHEFEAVCIWSVCHDGIPAVKFKVQHSLHGQPWVTVSDTVVDTFYVFKDLDFFGEHRVRVCGIDENGNAGPYSLPSKTYAPADSLHELPWFSDNITIKAVR